MYASGMGLALIDEDPRLRASSDTRQTGLVEDLMKAMIAIRKEARDTKNFATADSIRKHLASIGITLEDRPDGTIWRKE